MYEHWVKIFICIFISSVKDKTVFTRVIQEYLLSLQYPYRNSQNYPQLEIELEIILYDLDKWF